MKNAKLMKSIKERPLDCKTGLYNFFCYYQSLADQLYERLSGCPEESRESYMAGELCRWLEREGYFLIYTTVEQLDNGANDKLTGFVELYTFLLSCAEQDTFKLIDQLFYIPGQFAREFMREERMLVGEYANDDSDYGKGIGYTFSNKGTFAKVPCFLGG